MYALSEGDACLLCTSNDAVLCLHVKKNNMKQSNAETFNDVLRTCQSDAVDDICFLYMYIYMSVYIYIHIHMRGTWTYISCACVHTKASGTCIRSDCLRAMWIWWILCIWHLRGGWVGHVHSLFNWCPPYSSFVSHPEQSWTIAHRMSVWACLLKLDTVFLSICLLLIWPVAMWPRYRRINC